MESLTERWTVSPSAAIKKKNRQQEEVDLNAEVVPPMVDNVTEPPTGANNVETAPEATEHGNRLMGCRVVFNWGDSRGEMPADGGHICQTWT
eukprot:scaffold552683_cov32-Prasinocladus_malaysianus.AAC.1